MNREELVEELKRKFRVGSEAKLMDRLQDYGLVSDEAVTLEDCADRDLIAAWNLGGVNELALFERWWRDTREPTAWMESCLRG